VALELLEPEPLRVDLREDVAVGRARDAHSDGAGCAVPRQADDTHVVREVLPAKLRAEAEAWALSRSFFSSSGSRNARPFLSPDVGRES